MTEYLAALTSPLTIYDMLVADFARDGKQVASPQKTLLDAPPVGLGYLSVLAAQGFLDTYVNSQAGRVRYALGAGKSATYMTIPGQKKVGDLSFLISTLG